MIKTALDIIKITGVVTVLCCCNPSKMHSGSKQKEPGVKAADLNLERTGEQNKIVFLTMQITLTDSVRDEYVIEKKDVIYANGIMKKAGADMQNAEQHYLYCEVKDASGAVLDILKVENPLRRVFETSDEHTGLLEKHLISRKTGELVLRFNLNKETKYLDFYKLSANKLKRIYHAQL